MAEREVYRRIYLRLWRSPEFVKLTTERRLLALYLLAGPQTNQIGCYYFSPALAAEDLGMTKAQLAAHMIVVCEAFCWHWLEEQKLFYVPSWLDWNHPNSVNATKAWRDEAEKVRDVSLRACLLEGIRMSKPRRSRDVATQEQEQDQEQELPPNPPHRGGRVTARELKAAREHIARIGGCGHGLTHSVGECARMLALSWRGEQVSA